MSRNWKDIDNAKQRVIHTLNSRIDQMGSAAYNDMLQVIEEIFDFKGGKIEPGPDFIKKLNRLSTEIINLLQSDPKFNGPIGKFVTSLSTIAQSITDTQKSLNGITVPAFATVKKIVVDETVDQMLGNGLNQHFAQPLREIIYQNATSGLSMKEIRENIKEYIQGGKDKSGKLHRYIEQTSIQAADSYSGAINKKLLEEFSYDGLLITGSLIDNSSPQCRFAIEELGGTITRENWPQVVAHATKKFPLIEGTTFDNLPLNRLHWGCRHSFFPIILKQTA